ncbi:CapA family protein [Carboxylicivirga caseinilyticus]|uniref:CapA family protein n=1 Tax=Carboxylicivirga caseinilyticus TaxID=3417572 RepID=UPI003D34D459|nr:CapA family protein [Marinilabiliaceae bacterium A049]
MKTDPINILFTGDICPINRIEELALKGDYASIFNDFMDVFQGNDLNIVDLECPLTEHNHGRPKTGPYQKAHPDCINILKYAGVNVAAMANNHIMDYGSKGASDTIDLCRNSQIETIGIGKNDGEAAQPYTIEINGKKIAILCFADDEFISTPDNGFFANPLDIIEASYSIDRVRSEHDYVFVIVHAGNEFYELPSPRTKKLYRFLVDRGADAVIAHHTHAFSGYEVYNGKPVFYGLGNFIYDWPGKTNSPWNKGYVVKFSIDDQLHYRIIPLKQSNKQPGVFHLNADEENNFMEEMERLNTIIGDDEQLELAFQKYCDGVNPMYDAFIEPWFGKYITALRKRGLFPNLMSKRKRLLLLNIIRCESHRDVLLRMLKPYEKQ